jgi:hypothetical protein
MAFALGTTAGAGTISVVAGGTVVTGSGTNFVAANVGAIIVVGAQWGVIATRTSTTSIRLDRPFTTAVTGSAYTISANIPVITQTGTDTSLSGLAGVPGVTVSPSTISILYTITSATLVVSGSLIYNRLLNRLRFLNSASILTGSTSLPAMRITGTFNNSVSQSINGYSFNSPSYALLFESNPTSNSGAGNFIGSTSTSTSVFEGNIEFNLATSNSPQTFVLEGNTTLQNGSIINARVSGFNVQFTTTAVASTLTVNNYNSYGCGMRVLSNTTNINNYLSVGAAGAINQASTAAVNNPIYAGLQDGGGSIGWRTVNNSLKYFQLLNFASSRSSLIGLAQGNSTANSQTLQTNSLIVTALDSVGVVQGMKLWAKDSNNGNRCPANYGAGLGFEIATTGDLTYTGVTNASGVATFASIISAIFWQVNSGVNRPYQVDHRGNGGATSQNLLFYACSYNHNLAQQSPDMWAFNNATGLYNTTTSKAATYLLLADTSITETDPTIVAAYTTLSTNAELYDFAKYFLYTNFAGQTETYVTRSGNVINAGTYAVTIEATASVPFAIAGSTITIKSAAYTGGITTSGLVTLANGAVLSGSAITGNVAQSTPTNLTGVSITGNLTYNTNTPITITLTGCTITGTVSNSGSGLVTISTSGTTIGTVGANVATRPITSLNINGLTTGSQIYVANGAGAEVAYVASSGTSYTLDTTGQTGAWTYKVARYGFDSQTGTHLPAVATTTVTVTLLADLFISQATKATVAAYEVLQNLDRLYDYAALYETTNGGIRYPRIITKAGTSASAGSYSVTINDVGDLFVFDGSALSIWTDYRLEPGATITGALFTTGVVTIPTTFSDAAIIANVSQPEPGDLNNVDVTGNLTYDSSAPFGINVTLTDCAVSGTVSNAGTTDIVITKVNTTLGTVGARVTAQQFATISAPNLLAGTRVRVLNTTNNIEMFNDVLASAGFSQSFIFTGNKNITLTATYVNGATAKLGISASGIFTATGATFLDTQTDDTVYNGYAINGSAVTGFSADYAQDDVNLTVSTSFTAASLYAWWVYNTTTEQGIREFYGGITALDAANLRINTGTVSVFLDNSTASFIYQTDAIRIFRSDNAYPARTVTTGGGGISVNWINNVFVTGVDLTSLAKEASLSIVNNGVSGITTSLTTKPTLAQIEASTVLAKEASLVVINKGVQDASLIIPHTTDI